MGLVLLGTDQLSAIERRRDGEERAWLVLPEGCDADATVDLLVREAIGVREVNLLLLEREIEETRRVLEPIAARGDTVWDPIVGRPAREVPLEGVHLEANLRQLEAERRSLEDEIAALRGPEGPARVRRAMARYRVAPSGDEDQAVRAAGDAPVFALGHASYGLCDTMEERLRVRGWTLGLPEGHDETALREEERQRWEPPHR
ncbi:hypothetical protein [Sorangium sp. So ce1024]|uniref:hypothetical protein n=1 Tax=unclassified Sorangium TaxID=2621164 RepID=UPI003F078A7A